MEIKITQTTAPKAKPPDNTLGFGRYFTDHMFLMPYSAGKGWHTPEIRPYAPLQMDPASMVFHYAQECFEGLKAYRWEDGSVWLFRPGMNARRMAKTHKRLCIPELPEDVFVEAVRALTHQDKAWVPGSPDTSLYLRPFTIATEPHVGVKPSDSYLFCVIASPSGPYYAEGLNPIKIYVEDEYTRAAPGGMGAVKCGGNYAASLAGQMKAAEKGFSQVLWLDGAERKYVEEVGSMNCFFKINGQVLTAPTAPGTVLEGITRASCITLLQDWGVPVREARLSIGDLMDAARTGALEEVFGTGTAAVVSPVGAICYRDENAAVGGGKIGPLTQRLYDTLTGIQWGRVPDSKAWMMKVG